jgi:hypothetical protein
MTTLTGFFITTCFIHIHVSITTYFIHLEFSRSLSGYFKPLPGPGGGFTSEAERLQI